MLNSLIRYFLENRLVTLLLLLLFIGWGIATAPFDWDRSPLPTDPVPVDAIPNIGENQQIVFTRWPGRSPQDIEDQVSYPLTTYLLGLPGVKSIRSSSIFGFSSIYIIFEEDIAFYWSRSRILEKLSALPAGLLPEDAQPSLGPDATALGQVFWYTLEGRDSKGAPTGGWDLHEIRSVQDFYVKYGLNAVQGVSEVASIGGFVQEYQVDVQPDALEAYGLSFQQVANAVRKSNRDVGAKTLEINQVEYLVRGLGYVKKVADIEQAVVAVRNHVPILVEDVAVVGLGPSPRRGLLDKGGAEAVGGVVVARYGDNPMQVIQAVKRKIKELEKGLPKKILADGRSSQLKIIPFYDRSELIFETLDTLEEALSLQILISMLVIIIMVYHLRTSLLIASLLPIAVLIVFILMRYVGIEANIVALSGIAIAIGTMVDLGIILSENVLKKIRAGAEDSLLENIYAGAAEVSSAIVTAVSTTIVSFIPVFSMQQAEGKLFGPLAYTKTFALIAALIVTLLILPTLAYWFFGARFPSRRWAAVGNSLLMALGIYSLWQGFPFWLGTALLAFGSIGLAQSLLPTDWQERKHWTASLLDKAPLFIAALGLTYLLAIYWLPLGPARSTGLNFLFTFLSIGLILALFLSVEYFYEPILRWCLDHKALFLTLPSLLLLWGLMAWLGFATLFGWADAASKRLGGSLSETKAWTYMSEQFPGIGEEFMPALDEGSFLLMPTSMPHSGIAYNKKVLGQMDMILNQVPEVEQVVGKLGRVESALDPAPISMYENIIRYHDEYRKNAQGERQRYRVDEKGRFILSNKDTLYNREMLQSGGQHELLIPAEEGQYFRNWRSHIESPDDIWEEITKVTKIPGVTSAPKLQPIEARLVMLQTGMRAPMGIKVFGPDLRSIEQFSLDLEQLLKEVNPVKTSSVFAERIVGKPYLLIEVKRPAIARYGLSIEEVQGHISAAIGGQQVSATVEGRERYPIRVRYPRELRDNPEAIRAIQITTSTGIQIPLGDLVELRYERGPQAIKSENTFLVGYVLFDKKDGFAQVEVVEAARAAIDSAIAAGEIEVPQGISYRFSGDYENQVRASQRLSIILPIVLLIVFLILYFQFRSVTTALMIFSGIALAFSGGFILLWFYGQSWFADFAVFGTQLRDLFHIETVNLSVAVWVGFIALFGIATDDGVLMGTYLDQSFKRRPSTTRAEVREATVQAGKKRIRPAVMTSATTIIALLPILTASGRGADIMQPMAIPAFGGMLMAIVTYFIVPTLYAWREESRV